MTPLPQSALLAELEPVVAAELDRHLATAKEWFPHAWVPWSEGTEYDGPLDGQEWEPGQSHLDEVSRTAIVVNLLTEDNLPSYHRDIDATFGRDGAWGTWVGRWTAEEGRHAVAIRDYLSVTRAVDPVALERERMTHMTAGFRSAYPLDLQHGVAYVSFQELATRISHRNTGRHCGDPRFEALLARIAVDENLHMLFYRNVAAAAFERDADAMVCAVRDVVLDFAMPGATVEGYTRRALTIAMGGIYDLRIHHDEVITPVLRAWRFWELEGLGPQAEAARAEVAEFVTALDASASRFEEQRAARRARAAARG